MTDRKVEISASIMCIDWLKAGEQLAIIEAEKIDLLHWDLIDGRFAPDFTMGSNIINSFRNVSNIPSDYHLMIEEPSRIFESFQISHGDRLTIHQECCRNLHRDLIKIRSFGALVGVALCPATPLQTLNYIIEDIDQITIMTVNPGYSGQKLVPQTINKIIELKRWIIEHKLNIKIQVDGNVSYENIPKMVAAGADVLVGGSSGLFRKDIELKDSIAKMRKCIDEGLNAKRLW